MDQLTKEQAIAFAENELYKKLTSEQIVRLQLFQDKLCMPFGIFHKAIEDVLGRAVYTHEFQREDLMKEYLGVKPAPTLDEIIELIPADKRILITNA